MWMKNFRFVSNQTKKITKKNDEGKFKLVEHYIHSSVATHTCV